MNSNLDFSNPWISGSISVLHKFEIWKFTCNKTLVNQMNELFTTLSTTKTTSQSSELDIIWSCRCRCRDMAWIARFPIVRGNGSSILVLNIANWTNPNTRTENKNWFDIRHILQVHVTCFNTDSWYMDHVEIVKHLLQWN